MRGLVTLEVRSRYVGDGARVFVQRPGSELVIATTTDANGRLQAFIPEHSFVTVVLVPTDVLDTRYLYTQSDVNPGDELILDDGTIVSSSTISVRVPADDPDLGYQAFVPCFNTSTLQLVADQPGPVDLMGCAERGTLIVRSGFERFMYRHDVSFAQGGLVSLTDGAYEPYADIPLRVTNVPPTIQNVRARQTLLDGNRELWIADMFDKVLFFDGFTTTADTTLRSPTWPDARAITKVSAETFTPGIPTVYEWGPRGEPTTIDFGADALREYQTVPRYVPGANGVGWIEGDRGRLADALLAELQWFVSDELTTTTVKWRVFARRGEEPWLTVPVLPEPTLRPAGFINVDVTNIGIDGGYDRLRKLPLLGRFRAPRFQDEQFTNPGTSVWPIDAPTGRVVLVSTRFSTPEF